MRMIRERGVAAVLGGALVLGVGGCSTAPRSASEKVVLEDNAAGTIQRFLERDPSMQRFFDRSVGYAVFPTVGKGAIGVGGAYGRGIVYEDDRMIGYCDLTQGTIGFQLGGQAYSEIIFFDDAIALSNFRSGTLAFSAQATAVAASAGASADADYEAGVAVFTMTKTGLMYEASVGGQKFSFEGRGPSE